MQYYLFQIYFLILILNLTIRQNNNLTKVVLM